MWKKKGQGAQKEVEGEREKRGISLRCKEDLEGGFPGGSEVKNPPANAGDTGSIPGPGRFYSPSSS